MLRGYEVLIYLSFLLFYCRGCIINSTLCSCCWKDISNCRYDRRSWFLVQNILNVFKIICMHSKYILRVLMIFFPVLSEVNWMLVIDNHTYLICNQSRQNDHCSQCRRHISNFLRYIDHSSIGTLFSGKRVLLEKEFKHKSFPARTLG